MTKVNTQIIHEIAGKVNLGHEKDVVVHLFSDKPMAWLPLECVWAEYMLSIAVFNYLLKIIINNSRKLRGIQPVGVMPAKAVMGLTQPNVSQRNKREIEVKWSHVALKSDRPALKF